MSSDTFSDTGLIVGDRSSQEVGTVFDRTGKVGRLISRPHTPIGHDPEQAVESWDTVKLLSLEIGGVDYLRGSRGLGITGMLVPNTPDCISYAAALQGDRITDPGPDIFPFDPVSGPCRLLLLHNGHIIEWRGRCKLGEGLANLWWITPVKWPCPDKWALWRKAAADAKKKRDECLKAANASAFMTISGAFVGLAGSLIFTVATSGTGSGFAWTVAARSGAALYGGVKSVFDRQKEIDRCMRWFKTPTRPNCPESGPSLGGTFPG